MSLPAARFWEVPFVVPLTPLRIGVTWRDTLQFETEAEDLSELLSGVWQHEVTGDTVIDGRTLPVVRTQATLRYRVRDVTTDYALEEDLATTYDVSGRMVGTAVVDTAIGVRAAGADSTLLTVRRYCIWAAAVRRRRRCVMSGGAAGCCAIRARGRSFRIRCARHSVVRIRGC